MTFLKTIDAYYALDHPDYAPRWPAVESKATIRQNKAPKPRMRFDHVLDAFDAIPDAKRGPFITAYFTQRRWGEIRGIRGADYDPSRRLLTICRAKDGPEPEAPVRDRPKGKVGLYPMPQQFHEWVMKHCTERNGSEELPLFVNPSPEAKPCGGEWSHSAIRSTWRSACQQAGVPYTGPYEAFKHAIVTALL